MKLSAYHANLCTKALREITRRAQAAEQAPDTDAARKAVSAVRDACLQACDLINDAERETREAALALVEQAA